jgi:hypothetical protein
MKLTDSEITLLQQSLHTLDFAFHDQLMWSKQCAGRIWGDCDKNDPQTIENFKELNYWKKEARIAHDTRTIIASINKKLKQMKKGNQK